MIMGNLYDPTRHIRQKIIWSGKKFKNFKYILIIHLTSVRQTLKSFHVLCAWFSEVGEKVPGNSILYPTSSDTEKDR